MTGIQPPMPGMLPPHGIQPPSMIYNNYDLILAMGIAWAIYGAINILTIKKNRGQITYLAIAVILSFSFSILDHLIKANMQVQYFTNPLMFVSRNINFLIGPLLWLYVKSLLERDKIKWTTILIHSIPFILFLILMIVFNGTLFKVNIHAYLNNGTNPRPGFGLHIIVPLRMYGAIIWPIIYGFITIFRIREHRKGIVDFYSSKNIRNTLSWLSILLIAVVAISTAIFIEIIYKDLAPGPPIRNPLRLYLFYPVTFIFLFSLFSRDQKMQEDAKSEFKPQKYKNSPLGESTTNRIYEDFINTLEKNLSYLNPEITLSLIAEEINVSKHHLSQVINTKSERNFYGIINSYRLEEFLRRIENNDDENMTLLGVAMDCGFNSSSSFYNIFKKEKGTTPKKYIDSLLRAS